MTPRRDANDGGELMAVTLCVLSLCVITLLGVWSLVASSNGDTAKGAGAAIAGGVLGASLQRLFGRGKA